jgi:hypothetical protein
MSRIGPSDDPEVWARGAEMMRRIHAPEPLRVCDSLHWKD